MSEKRQKIIKIVTFAIWFSFPLLDAARQQSFKINTDLTASVIDGGGPNAGGVVDTDSSATKITQNQFETSKLSNSNVGLFNESDTHLCTREETYIEQIEFPIVQPVRVRSSSWCLEFPPRCSNYKTEMRQVMQAKNVTKTRTIRFCCHGYEASTILLNDTVCKPVCRGGCGRGQCKTPDVCTCDPGYTGKHCTERCDHDHWGVECKNTCQCLNGAACDNKSGICHCITGWTGELCELPCPSGTHGVMCRKVCECSSKHCHPQTGECESPPLNATHAIIATLNSTIANITHNLDRLAKNIVNITPKMPNAVLIPDNIAVTAKSPMPEVIVIKQDETAQTPKIIVHQQGSPSEILESLHNAMPKSSDVIHVITHDEKGLHLAGFGEKHDNDASTDSSIFSTLLIFLLIILIVVALSFLYVYRRYYTQKQQVKAAIASRSVSDGIGVIETSTVGELNSGSLGKSFPKPLPDLPAFTQMVRNKIEAHEYYDSPPSSNISIHTAPYAYARKESLYSVVPPKPRRGSPDSHLYDEIRYSTEAAQHHFYHHQQQQQQHQQQQYFRHHPYQQNHHNEYQQRVQQQQHQPQVQSEAHATYNTPRPISQHDQASQLIIPSQNSNYLQVPPAGYTTHKVAHM